MKNILITGGAGFIGSNFIHFLLNKNESIKVINLDKLTYASNPDNLGDLPDDRYSFVEGDIADSDLVYKLMKDFSIKYLINFAAESHVDNSIENPEIFFNTNVYGVFNLLNSAYRSWMDAPGKFKEGYEDCRFYQISTDEVFGSLPFGKSADEKFPYNPCNPYSASKASADMLVNSYFNTYGLPTLISRSSNNYGKYQHSEKFIPKVIKSLLSGQKIPIYGDGNYYREWLFVDDHCEAIYEILFCGRVGESYNIGSSVEISNVALVEAAINLINKMFPTLNVQKIKSIEFVEDRPGHDWRYSLNSSKIFEELGWKPETQFLDGLKKTIEWFYEKQNRINANGK